MESGTTQRTGRGNRREAAWLRCLREQARLLEQVPVLERRRTDLVAGVAERSGASLAALDIAYDRALEEGLDPALALEIVGCGVAVIDLTEPEPVEGTHTLRPPDWVAPVTEPPSEQVLERRMRLTFRRMRAMLEKTSDLESAVERFSNEVDVGPFTYDVPAV
ncbi:MAG: hypothetical protein ACREMA_03180 [Longimicrobiales bacterium]